MLFHVRFKRSGREGFDRQCIVGASEEAEALEWLGACCAAYACRTGHEGCQISVRRLHTGQYPSWDVAVGLAWRREQVDGVLWL